MTNLLNKTRALKRLCGPLKFGDEDQIEAARWLETAAVLERSDVEFERCCDRCDGAGKVSGDFDPSEARSLSDLRELAAQVEETE